MANTTLRAYLDELNLLLEQEALEEVIGHCRHILQHFPKNVETYRILGRSLLDRQRFDEAGDIFQRVLSALPDDFVSHLGLSAVSEEKGQFPAAIWHLEQAYEQDPNNKALQDELKRLYERRDGAAPDRIQLTRASLVRTYAKGRLYEQAASEARAALKQSPERIDLWVLLAQIMWDSDHPIEAGEIALQVLEKLPNCIEANRLLASLWLRNGRPAEAAPFIARLEQLDPFVAWQTAQPDGKALPADAFQLPHLQWDARAAAALATDVPDWVNAISNVFEAPEEISLSDSGTDWFGDTNLTSPPPPTPKRPSSRLSRMAEPAPAEEAPVEMPDWAQDFMADTGAPGEDEIPDWFKETPPEVVESASTALPDLPDWFEEAVNAPPPPPTPMTSWSETSGQQLPSGFTDLLESDTAFGSPPIKSDPTAIEIPDWLTDAAPAEPPPSQPQPAVQIPDWLTDEEPTPQPAANLPAQPQPAVQIPDWLTDEEPTSQPEASTSDAEPLDAMAWLTTEVIPSHEVTAPTESPGEPGWPEVPVQATESSVEQVDTASLAGGANLDWLSDTPVSESSAIESVQMGDLDWLSGTPAVESAAADVSAPSSDMDWLSSVPDVPSAEPVAEAQPEQVGDLDWLSSVPSIPSAEPVAGEPTSVSDLDWLSEIPSTEPTATPEPLSAGDMDWLNSMPSAEPAASESEQDWFGSLASAEPTPAPEAEPAEAGGLDWLSSMPSVESSAEVAANQFAEMPGLNEADSEGRALDWQYDMAEPESVDMGDPMAWLHPYQAPTADESLPPAVSAVSDSLDETDRTEFGSAAENEPLAPGERPDWLSAMAPAQPASQSIPEPTEKPATFDWMAAPSPVQAGSDWLESLDSPLPPVIPEQQDQKLQPEAAAEPAVEIEDEWLASFEIQPESTSEAEPSVLKVAEETPEISDDWMSSFAPTAAAPSAPADDWLSSLATGSSAAKDEAAIQDSDWMAEAPLAQPAADDWLGSLAASEPEPEKIEEPAQWTALPETTAPDDWLSSFRPEEPAAADAAPAWMAEISRAEVEPTPAADETSSSAVAEGDYFESLLKQAAEKANQPRVIGDTGVLNPEQVPDWLVAFEAESEEHSQDIGEAVPAAEGVPDWMADMAPGEKRRTTSIDELDFSDLSEPAETAGESPDWLATMAPDAQPAAESADWLASAVPDNQLDRPVAGTPIEELDFSSLEFVGQETAQSPESALGDFDFAHMLSGQEKPSETGTPDEAFDFNFQSVAQPTNLVNTSDDIVQETGQAFTFNFNFDRKPAWMRKKGASGGNVPRWMKKTADPAHTSRKQDDDSPDWLKD